MLPLAYETTKHGFVAAAAEANGCDMIVAKGVQIGAVEDLVGWIVGEIWMDVGQATQCFVDGICL